MTWDRLPPISTYPKARRKELLRRVGTMLAGGRPQTLLDLEDVREALKSYQQSYLGMRAIPVADITGSVSRSVDFDDEFLPLGGASEQRWQSVENAFPDGSFPPITVYKVGSAYFVSDGHHRVAIAKQRKLEYIDAEITEVHTPYEVTADTDVAQLVHLGQQRIFMDTSGLARVVPKAQFRFTRPEGYAELLDNLKVHGWDMVVGRSEYVTREEIALHWYQEVYLPTVRRIEESGLVEMMSDVTLDDLFLWVADRWRRLFPERGALTFEEIIDEAAGQEADKLTNKAKAVVDRVDDAIDTVVDRVRGRPDDSTPDTGQKGPTGRG